MTRSLSSSNSAIYDQDLGKGVLVRSRSGSGSGSLFLAAAMNDLPRGRAEATIDFGLFERAAALHGNLGACRRDDVGFQIARRLDLGFVLLRGLIEG